MTQTGRNNPDGNVIVADAETGNAFAGIGMLFSSGIGFGFHAGFDANDSLVVGNLNADNDAPKTGLSLGAPRDEIVVADPDTGIVDVFHYDETTAGPIYEVDSLDLEFAQGDSIALADVDRARGNLDGVDEILIAKVETGAVHGFDPDGTAHTGRINEANYVAGDGFTTGNVDGFGNVEFLVGRAATGVVDVFDYNTGSIDVLFGTFDGGFETGDRLAVADITGNGTEEIILADVSTGEVRIYTYDIREDPAVDGDEFLTLRSFDAGIGPSDSFSVVPVRYPDVDNDGLRDDWERDGLDADNDGVIDLDLPSMGADVRHKDLFVELDWERFEEPSRSGIQTMKDAFARAPANAGGTFNLDQQPGINLWVDTGNLMENGLLVGDNLGGGNQITSPAQNICNLNNSFYAVKAQNFDPVRRMVFRYGLSADGTGCGSGGWGELGGNDFIEYQHDGGTIMHELGHTLGLFHGGGDIENCKPNYLSVMNYDHQFGISQTDGTSILDYSPPRTLTGRGTAPLPSLNEDGGLSEATVLDPTDANNRFVFTDSNGSKILNPMNMAADWNGDGIVGGENLRVNISDANDSGNPARCDNDDFTVLEGHDDWTNISVPFRHFGDAADGAINPTLEPEPTHEELVDLKESQHTTDLAIDVNVEPDPAVAGEELVYTVMVTNYGPNPADAVELINTLPAGVTYLGNDGNCPENAGTVECNPGILLANESFDIAITVLVEPDFVFTEGPGATLRNAAEAVDRSEFAQDPNPDNNQIVTETTVVAVADLEIVSFEVADAPAEVLVGESTVVSLAKVVTNNGPSGPVDVAVEVVPTADSGLSLIPNDSNPSVVPALDISEQRPIVEQFSLECVAPGTQTVTFTNTITAEADSAIDLEAANNTAEVDVLVECILPVAINIKPGGFPNPVQVDKPNGNVPLAVLTTEGGEYGLPRSFDATTIDPLSVLFGARDGLLYVDSPSGATERHGKGHIEDAIELDESTRDGDLDMVLHFRTAGSGLDRLDTEACVRGTFIDPQFGELIFFGCDAIMSPGDDNR
ncbi:MAG: hypothetical protein R2849_11085 [Thermomicrobiales bacterium]